MLQLSDVTKGYFGQAPVLDRVSLDLQKGGFLYVVGGSGAGKSTLLRMLATEEMPSSGVISLFGYSLHRVSPSTLRAIRQTIGYIPQGIRLIPDLSIYDNIALSLKLAGRRALGAHVKSRIHELLERLGLARNKDKLCQMLSGGEAQRVAVARALVRSPEMIIGDEPTGAQDRDYTWSLMELFTKINQTGTTVVLATHDREIVRKVRKPSAVLRGGHVSIEENACIY